MHATLVRLRKLGEVAGARLVRHVGELASFALPQRCPGCGAAAEPARLLCPTCLARIPRLSFSVCARCLANGRDGNSCFAHPGFEVWPAWVYDERAAAAIHAFKFADRTALALEIAAELERVVPPGRFDAVFPVPLHRARRRERGYNQAALLGAALARRIGAPFLERGLERARATAPQTRLGPAQRRRNLRAAFRISSAGWIADREVLLVDDVMTTGATLEAALGTLRDAGARATAVTLAWAQ